MSKSKLVTRNNKLCTTKANTLQGLIDNSLDRPLAIRTRDTVGGMVVDMVVGMVVGMAVGMVVDTMATHGVREALLLFPSWVPLLVVYC